jgi:hypothetical protein
MKGPIFRDSADDRRVKPRCQGRRRVGDTRDAESHQDYVGDEPMNTAPPWRLCDAREPDGLARAGTEREGDVTPGVEKGRRGRQMEDDAARRTDDMDAELE